MRLRVNSLEHASPSPNSCHLRLSGEGAGVFLRINLMEERPFIDGRVLIPFRGT